MPDIFNMRVLSEQGFSPFESLSKQGFSPFESLSKQGFSLFERLSNQHIPWFACSQFLLSNCQILVYSYLNSTMTLHHKIANWLFVYCTTPHTFMQGMPPELFLKHRLRMQFCFVCYNCLYRSSLKISNSKRPPVQIKCKRNWEILHRVT